MSQTNRQRGFSDFTDEYAHLAPQHLSEVPPDTGVKLEADPDKREAWCRGDDGCQNRITVGPDGDEYGHANDCEHSTWEPQQ